MHVPHIPLTKLQIGIGHQYTLGFTSKIKNRTGSNSKEWLKIRKNCSFLPPFFNWTGYFELEW